MKTVGWSDHSVRDIADAGKGAGVAAAVVAEPRASASAGGASGLDDRFNALRGRLHRMVKTALAERKLHDEIQYELGCWIRLLDTTEDQFARASRPREALGRLVRQADIAIQALLSNDPELLFARTLRYRIEMELRRHGEWASRCIAKLSDGDPAVLVGAGVFLTMGLGVFGYLIVNWLTDGMLSNEAPIPGDGSIVTVLQAAFLGGGVSILARLREFSCARVRDFDPFLLFWNALFNPVVAMIFATFVYAALTSGLLPLEAGILEKLTSAPALWVIGFLTGFSERFTSDVIARAESAFGVKKQS